MADIRERASKAAHNSNRHSLTPTPLIIPSFCSFHFLHIISLFLWVYEGEREREILCFFWGCFVSLSIHAQSPNGYISWRFLVGVCKQVCVSIISSEVTHSYRSRSSLPLQGQGLYRPTQDFDGRDKTLN
ncbi:hypothetical protein EUGRSUZ_B00827 [Eucalyptus grandis]|uniref:Uncharacterized protein n=2 Tax=Eucalyptus grandis TaxID=71139 RepID=A0ACC3LQC8_EUCGR|nr:hypothetical protein EUGRSUZ_B00827 [Eucalyptus grandis]